MKLLTTVAILFFGINGFCQRPNIYSVTEDAEKMLQVYIRSAKEQKKHVLIQAGGNWCKWCIEFERFVHADPKIDSVIRSAYVVYHLNFSTENMNKKTFAKLGFPQRFGFPVFIILNGNGERIHIQNSEYLEDQKISSYNKIKVQSFLEMWTPRAINPKMYE